MSDRTLNLEDMTYESAIRYAYSCLQECLAEGWKFDWRYFMIDEHSEDYKGQKLCCMAGAIKVKNPDAYHQSAHRVDYDQKSRVGYVSQLCRRVQIEKDGLSSQTIIPTLDELIAGHHRRIVNEYR